MNDGNLNYKGYTGTIEFSEEDNCYFGKLLYIRDLVLYEAENAEKLPAAFEEAVDGYLDMCTSNGLKPDVPRLVIAAHS